MVIIKSYDSNSHYFRNNMLECYPQINGEVQVKIGGDHGGKSFKACYQVLNREHQNSKDNTVVFSLFETKDYGLGRFNCQIDDLQTMKWL